MSTVSLADLLVVVPEQDIVHRTPVLLGVLGEPVQVALDPVLVERPTLLVDIVVESGPVDFRVLRALRPRRRATKAQKHTRMGE